MKNLKLQWNSNHVTRALIAYQTRTKTVQELPDPSFRMLVMQYIQRRGDRRGLGSRLWKYMAYWSLSTFVLSICCCAPNAPTWGEKCTLNGFLAQHVFLFSELHCLPVHAAMPCWCYACENIKITIYVVDNSNVALIILASCVLGMMFLWPSRYMYGSF